MLNKFYQCQSSYSSSALSGYSSYCLSYHITVESKQTGCAELESHSCSTEIDQSYRRSRREAHAKRTPMESCAEC
ncbi:hypothetical protein QQF64_032759 [Cirrhinus molitorella]|uniref:Uncharacterized protein n=1 Tax=Cirrhinus molitorella TaxID=172907 RepID=A0ABR3MRZ9_9TELE